MNCEALILITYCVFACAQYNVMEFKNDGPPGCVTPILEEGRCISIHECPLLLNLLQSSPRRPEVDNYLLESLCAKSTKVCCPHTEQQILALQVLRNPSTTARPPATEGPLYYRNLSDHPNIRLLPENCGLSFVERIVGGDEAALGEYPWMALLEYTRRNDGRKEFTCGGSLISKRYVLTAAHCIYGKPSRSNLTGVILGEHNTTTNPDCQTDDHGETICQLRSTTIGIESAVMHKGYRHKNKDHKHDIGLIRLRQSIFLEGTSHIKAICFPRDELLTKDYVGDTAVVAGWGSTKTSNRNDVLRHVVLPIVDIKDCARLLSRNVGTTQICAGGEPNKDSCRGDSGGPLMVADSLARNSDKRLRLFVVGVVSYGPADPCGDGRPGVYTKVGAYAKWILDTMRY